MYSDSASGFALTMAPQDLTTGANAPRLYPGETLTFVGGDPCMYNYNPPESRNSDTTSTPESESQKKLPLVVLIPGGAHNGRIFYGGHDGHHPADYLSFWLNKLGLPVLAVSYPLESTPQLMPPVSPAFRIHEWGRQAALVTRKVIDATPSLNGRDILLIGWSMGGRILAPFTETATKELGLRVCLFISLAATPGVAGMRPPPPGVIQTQRGYATCDGLLDTFVSQISDRIPEEIYRTEYYGHTPVSLHGWRLAYHSSTGNFEYDHWGSEEDASPSADDFSILPWMATIVGTEIQDARHVLVDRAAWAYLNVQRLTSIWENRHKPLRGNQDINTSTSDENFFSASSATTEKEPKSVNGQPKNGLTDREEEHKQWDTFSSFVLETVSGALTCQIPGNHYFFLGAEGAQRTANSVAKLWRERNDLEQQLQSILTRGRL